MHTWNTFCTLLHCTVHGTLHCTVTYQRLLLGEALLLLSCSRVRLCPGASRCSSSLSSSG